MANPFSGLENIGQSYLQGVQLANQRQYREEAAAQRAEDTRVRGQYYTQMGADREAALKERIQARLDAAASQFGQDLILNPQGLPDYAGSALKRDRRLQSDTLAGAEGELYAMYGTQPPLSPEVIGSPAYQAGRLRGTARTMADKRAENVALIRRGFIPFGQSGRQLPVDVENQIEGFSPDIFDGGGEPLTEAPMGAGAPSGGGQIVTIGGQQYRAPAAALKKTEKAGTMKFTDPNGVEYSLPVSPEAARDLLTKRLASPEGEQDPYADIDEALKNLRKLAKNKDDEVNVYEDAEGNVKVRKDQFGFIGESKGLTFGEAKAQLELKRKDRQQMRREMETPPGPEAGIKQGTNRVPSSPNQVIDVRSIPNLPRIGRGTNAPVATTNAPPQVRLPVDSLAPANSMSSESLSELDLDELRQAMLEAQANGMDPAVLGLQLRQALNQSGVPTAAGTNSLPLGLSQEQFDAILRMPRGRAPVEL